MYIHICVCVYIYIYIYAHTYTSLLTYDQILIGARPSGRLAGGQSQQQQQQRRAAQAPAKVSIFTVLSIYVLTTCEIRNFGWPVRARTPLNSPKASSFRQSFPYIVYHTSFTIHLFHTCFTIHLLPCIFYHTSFPYIFYQKRHLSVRVSLNLPYSFSCHPFSLTRLRGQGCHDAPATDMYNIMCMYTHIYIYTHVCIYIYTL